MTDDVAIFSPRLRHEETPLPTMADVEVLRYGPAGEVLEVKPLSLAPAAPSVEPAAAPSRAPESAPTPAKPRRPKLSERAVVKQGKP